jgi:hypothetical protein
VIQADARPSLLSDQQSLLPRATGLADIVDKAEVLGQVSGIECSPELPREFGGPAEMFR